MQKRNIMTKSEIVEKVNSYKTEYNIYNYNVDQYHKTLSFFSRYKQYFSTRATKTKTLKSRLFISAIISLFCCIGILTFSPLVAIPVGIFSVLFIERFLFYYSVNKKFQRCADIFEKLEKKAQQKEHICLNKKEDIMSHIIALEKEIPEDVKETINMIENEEFIDAESLTKF